MTEVIGVIVDCETGGLDSRRDALLQVGAVAFGIEEVRVGTSSPLGEPFRRRLVEVDSFKVDILPNPKLSVCMEALKVSGTIPAEVWNENRVHENEAFRQFVSWLGNKEPYKEIGRAFWAHNAPFDAGFMIAWNERTWGGLSLPEARRWACTHQLAVTLRATGRLPNIGKAEFSSSLSGLCRRFGIETARDQTGHDALGDCRLTLEVLNYLWKAAGWL